MEAVRRLRDVMILSVFVLSIFALVGLQIYQGALSFKCIKIHPEGEEWFTNNATEEEKELYGNNMSKYTTITYPGGLSCLTMSWDSKIRCKLCLIYRYLRRRDVLNMTPRCFSPKYTEAARLLRYIWRNVLRYVTLRYVTLRYVTLRYVTLRYVTLRYPCLHIVLRMSCYRKLITMIIGK